jgi:flagellar hook assembly protein FlgD
VYDISGRIVSTQHYANMAAGYQTITWDSKNFNGAELPSGIYLYKLQAGQKTATKKMVLLK